MSINDVGIGFAYAFIRTSDPKRIWMDFIATSPPVPLRVSFDPEDLRIEGNPFRVR